MDYIVQLYISATQLFDFAVRPFASTDIIWLDWPLAITGILFLILGYLYGWGLLFFFRNDFRWHRASVVGILSVVCVTATLVWYPRYGNLAWDIAWSLFVVFSLALPAMVWVGLELKRDQEKCQQEHETEICRLRREILVLCEKLRSIQTTIKIEGEGALPKVENILEMSTETYGVGIFN